MKFWVRGKQSTKIPSEKCDVVRLPRSLNDIEYRKANEFRTFFLFTGHIVLKGRLKKQLYLNFIKLHGAIEILVTPGLCLIKNNIAYNLRIDFVKEFRIIYGAHFVTHNIHSLIHLPFYAKIHGCLNNFSALYCHILSDVSLRILGPRPRGPNTITTGVNLQATRLRFHVETR